MALRFVPYTPDWEPAVARFNERMRAGNAPSAFGIPEHAGTPSAGLVSMQHVLAVEDTEVRGGVLILEHPASVGGAIPARQTVINLQSPLSEGIINPKYAMLAIQLIRFAVKRCPYAYVVGMGSLENPLPRLLKASGWNVRAVPFFFRILRARRSLANLTPLRKSAPFRLAGQVAGLTGTAALALLFIQRSRASARDLRAVPVTDAGPLDDKVWSEIEKRISFGVVRDSSTLPRYLVKKLQRFQVFRGDECLGWLSLLISQMRGHSYFGDLKVATLVDIAAAHAADLPAFAVLAGNLARAAGCDLMVSNQLQAEAQSALRSAGFLSHGSNYLIASSVALSALMVDDTSFITRQDGDGLVNLHAQEQR